MSSTIATDTAAEIDARWLDRAVDVAVRAHGHVSPNPLVGCVVLDASGDVVGIGHHRRCGLAHAEVEALSMAREGARGGTVYVTLEPCVHHGKTGPCAHALIEAGVARVVIGTRDPNPCSAGGLEQLIAAGVDAVCLEHEASTALAAPFLGRVESGLPWITAKWAQTSNGFMAPSTGTGVVSSLRSRRLVHRERGRVDAVLTGIGTVLADDPQLTPRQVRIRRMPLRIVIDPEARTPVGSRLVQSADDGPIVLVASPDADATDLASRGIEIHRAPVDADGHFNLTSVLRALSQRDDLQTILTEAGPGLLSGLFNESLISEVAVFVAPVNWPDGTARAPLDIPSAPPAWLTLRSVHQRDGDTLMRYGVNAKSEA